MLNFLHNHGPLLLLFGALAMALHLLRSGQAPFLIDALFVGLLLARPSLPAAALLVVQYGARRLPVSARGMAGWWGLMPGPVASVLLPGAGGVPARRLVVEPTIALPPAPPAPLPSREWLYRLNHDETAPHTAVVGPTRAGKTTLVQAVLGNRPGQVVICTPKPAGKDPWGGAPAVRLGDERGDVTYAPLADAVHQVYDEMLRRNRADAAGQPLTLVLDDYSTLVAERPEVRPWVLRLWTMAASCGVRVVIIDTEESVKAWGIEGRGDARGNLIFVRVNPDRSAVMYRWGGALSPIDTRDVKQLADHARLAARGWPGLSVWSAGGDLEPQTASDRQTDGRQTADDDLIEYLMERGHSRDKARAWLGQRGMGLDNNLWTKVAARRKVAA